MASQFKAKNTKIEEDLAWSKYETAAVVIFGQQQSDDHRTHALSSSCWGSRLWSAEIWHRNVFPVRIWSCCVEMTTLLGSRFERKRCNIILRSDFKAHWEVPLSRITDHDKCLRKVMLYPSLNFIFSASSASLRMCILESQPTISERIESSWGSSLRYKGCQVFCIIEANRTLFCRQELQNLIIPCSSRRSIAKVQIQKWVNRSVYNCRSIRDVRSLSISEYELTASLNLCQGWMRISVHCT